MESHNVMNGTSIGTGEQGHDLELNGLDNLTDGALLLSSTGASSDYQTQQKIENLKATVKELYLANGVLEAENKKLKMREKGLSTVAEMLAESRQQNQNVTGQLNKVESTLALFRSRLLGAGLSVETYVGENEAFYPTPSKDTIQKMARKIAKLQDELKFSHCDAHEVERMTKKIKDLESLLEKSTGEVETLKAECSRLQSLLRGSGDDREREISRLQDQLDGVQQTSLTQDVLCHSLSQETHSLKQQLKIVSSQCQQLAKKLENGAKSQENGSGEFLATTKEKTHNDLLERKLKEVIEMNTRWQSYNDQRDQYVKKLHRDMVQLKEGTPCGLTEAQQQQMDKIFLASKHQVDALEDEQMKLEDENRHLRIELDKNKRDTEAIRKRIRDLEAEVTKLSRRASNPEDRDRIQVLQAQVEILSDDFRLERQDREAAQAKITELEEALAVAQRQAQAQYNVLEDPSVKRARALQRYEDEFYAQQQQRRLTERGGRYPNYYGGDVVVDGPNGESANENEGQQNGFNLVADGGYDEIDGFDEIDENRTDVLQCPRCMKEFSQERHADLLEHVDVCCD